ncbi:unnamed protein product [Linum tenue]|uniref:F-box domain-containing protein n=1 Tax=Linum tenue TaxID=586396 RepID=A0AAV0Q4B4_9ROSI|nr:unnamed protein product [Linum tenue]
MSSSSRELSEELVLEIISGTGTVHDVVRCSSLLSKRWRNIWRSIPGEVLDFDKSDELLWGQNELVDRIRVITKRVKEFTLLSFHSSSINWLSFRFFTPEFLSKHDLSRLEVLEINGVSDVSQRAVDHFQPTHVGELAVLRVCSDNNLQCLDIGELWCVARIELISAPRLRTFKLRGYSGLWVEYRDDLPQLQETLFSCTGYLFPWTRYQFLSKHDLSRLEVLEINGVSDVSQRAVDHFQPTHVGELAVLRVCSDNNLQCLDIGELWCVARIELISAPRLRTFKLRGLRNPDAESLDLELEASLSAGASTIRGTSKSEAWNS